MSISASKAAAAADKSIRTAPDFKTAISRVFANRAVQIIAVEVVVVVIFQSLSPNGAFLSSANIHGILLTASQVLLLAAGQAVLMAAGQIDISQGALLILTSVVSGKVMISMGTGTPPSVVLLAGLIAAIVTGVVLGAINAIFVGIVGINSLVTTLGMLSLATGAAQVVTKGVNLVGIPVELGNTLGTISIGVFPLPMVLALVLLVIIWLAFRFTSWGTHTLAMGSNFLASRRVGIKTLRNTFGIFILSAVLAGFAGYIDLARYSTTNISGHINDSLAAIAAALIGGTALTGGRINFLGVIVGAFLAIILQSGLVIINLSPFYQTIAIGAMLLIAVSLDRSSRNRRTG